MKRFHFYEADTGGGGGGDGLLTAPTPVAPPAASPAQGWTWAKEDGTFSEGWRDKLPVELRSEASLATIGSVDALAKGFIETKKLVGKKLEAPGSDATPEQLTAWRKTVGAPDKPEGYYNDSLKSYRPESVPETMWDAESEKKFLAVAHKHSLPPAAVKEIMDYYGGSLAAGVAKMEADGAAQQVAEKANLQKAWGADYDANSALALRVAQTVGLDGKEFIRDAQTAIAFAKLGKLFSEDRLVAGEPAGISGGVRERIQDIQDPKSQSVPAREYRGEFGPERSRAAQAQLHDLIKARDEK